MNLTYRGVWKRTNLCRPKPKGKKKDTSAEMKKKVLATTVKEKKSAEKKEEGLKLNGRGCQGHVVH